MSTFQLALNHFETADPLIFNILKEMTPRELVREEDTQKYFHSLASSIVSQQLSTKVADVIMARVEALMPEGITPSAVLALEDQQLRDVGMSWSKVSFFKDLAQKTLAQEIAFHQFIDWEHEQIIEELTKVKGIGRWTVEMFLMFTLGQPDVFSIGDGGLKAAVKNLYGLDAKNDKEKIEQLAMRWSPYRSYASLALWRSLENK